MLRGELDLHGTRELCARVRAELPRDVPIVIELTGLDFADLHGFRALTGLIREAARRRPPIEVEMHGARGQVASLIARLSE